MLLATLAFLMPEQSFAYDLLAPIPGGPTSVDPAANDLAYFNSVYKVILALVIVLSVLMIVIGGIQYAAAGINPAGKADAKNRITYAIGGLILALASVVILGTINPTLVSLETGVFEIPEGPLNPDDPNPPEGGVDDADGRQEMRDAGIIIGLPNCNTNGNTSPCGNVQGMKRSNLNHILEVKDDCRCLMVFVDATGPGHDPNGAHPLGVGTDLDDTATLNNHVLLNPDTFRPAGFSSGGDRIFIHSPSGAMWMCEGCTEVADPNFPGGYTFQPKQPGAHWHIDTRAHTIPG